MIRLLLLLLTGLLLTACDRPDDPPARQQALHAMPEPSRTVQTEHQAESGGQPGSTVDEPITLLNEPTQLHRFETVAEALSIWRQYAGRQPTLLLLSNNPHLVKVPEELREEANTLVHTADRKSLARKSSDRTAAPVLLPGMAVDMALRAGWFQEIAWVLPLRDPETKLSLEKFTGQLATTELADAKEIASLERTDHVLQGTLRQTPFTAAALLHLQDISQPVIVHLDLSYFQPIYKNEVSTPLLDIVYETLTTLKKMHLQTLAVTFSYGHLDSQIALDVRFLGDILAYLIEDPTRLEQPIPLNWQRQRDALYLANFFQKEKIRELYEDQEQDAPNAAYIKFNLYRSSAEHKEGTRALDYLADAVTLDPVYALEYLQLSGLAYERQRPDEALRMLRRAAEVFHTDPFIKLQMAQVASEIGDKETALQMLNKLRNLQWSKAYYPQMQEYLADLTAYVQSAKPSEVSGSGSRAENKIQTRPEESPGKQSSDQLQ